MNAPEQLSLLLVGQDPGSVIEFERQLDGMGISVTKTWSVSEALRALDREEYFLTVIDLLSTADQAVHLPQLMSSIPRAEHMPLLFVLPPRCRSSDIAIVCDERLLDTVVKPLHGPTVRARVRTFLELFRTRLALADEIIGQRQAVRQAATIIDRLRTMATTAKDAVIVVDDAGLVTLWNDAAVAYFSLEAPTAIGKPAHLLICGKDKAHVVTACIERADGQTVTVTNTSSTGQRTSFEMTCRMWQIMGQRHRICVIRDISARVRSEEKLIEGSLAFARQRSLLESYCTWLRTTVSTTDVASLLSTTADHLLNNWPHPKIVSLRLTAGSDEVRSAEYSSALTQTRYQLTSSTGEVGELHLICGDGLVDETANQYLTAMAYSLACLIEYHQLVHRVAEQAPPSEELPTKGTTKEAPPPSELLDGHAAWWRGLENVIEPSLMNIVRLSTQLCREPLSRRHLELVTGIGRTATALDDLVRLRRTDATQSTEPDGSTERALDLETMITRLCNWVRCLLYETNVELICSVDEELPTIVADQDCLSLLLFDLARALVRNSEHDGTMVLETRMAGWNEESSTVSIEFSLSTSRLHAAKDDRENHPCPAVPLVCEKKAFRLGSTIESLLDDENTVAYRFTLVAPRHLGVHESATEANCLFSGRALIVDDNRAAGTILQQLLREVSFECTVVENEQSALIALERKRCDIVFIDYDEPGEAAEALAAAILARFGERSPLLVACHGSNTLRPQSYSHQLWHDALVKPILRTELRSSLRHCLHDRTRPEHTASARDNGTFPDRKRAQSILVVDDGPLNRTVARSLLEEQGFIVTEARNGKDAIDVATTTHVDLIIMDVQMPEMNGIAASKALRAIGCDVPIIGCTAESNLDEKETLFEAGMNDVLMKPFQQQELMAVVRRFCSLNETAFERAGCTIVCVDDDPSYLDIMACALGDSFPHATVHRAESGVAACALFGRLVPDIVVTDLSMPDVDGLGVLDFLKNASPFRHTVVGIVSGSRTDSDLRQRALAHGANFYLEKPFSVGDLIKATNTALNERARSESPMWDRARIDRVLKGDMAFLAHLLELFVAEVYPRLDRLEQTLTAGESLELVATEAHAVKGAAANLGAMRLAEACHACLLAARRKDVLFCRKSVPDIRQLAEDVVRLIRSQLPND